MNRLLSIVVTLLAGLLLTGCGNHSADPGPAPSTPAATPTAGAAPATGELKTTPSGLQYQDLAPGEGPKPLLGQTVVVHYTGTFEDGKEFDSSRDGRPISFKLGRGEVIKGWDIGIGGDGGNSIAPMRVGGRRRLIIPASLGYGAEGSGRVPPNATLIFEVELVDIRQMRSF